MLDRRRRHADDDDDTGIPVYVRVGPYNVNPETAIDNASVISHEYGHSLGLPDYYSTGSARDLRRLEPDGDRLLPAHRRHRQAGARLGRPARPRARRDHGATDWKDTKIDTARSTGAARRHAVHAARARACTTARPTRRAAAAGGSSTRRSCRPATTSGGPAAATTSAARRPAATTSTSPCPSCADVPAGTPVTLTFKSTGTSSGTTTTASSSATTDNGATYTSLPSEKGYTTPARENPNANGCQTECGNGLTGTSGSYDGRHADGRPARGQLRRRAASSPTPTTCPPRRQATRRCASRYFTDRASTGRAGSSTTSRSRPATQVIYETDFETADDSALFNGGCRDGLAGRAIVHRRLAAVDRR